MLSKAQKFTITEEEVVLPRVPMSFDSFRLFLLVICIIASYLYNILRNCLS